MQGVGSLPPAGHLGLGDDKPSNQMEQGNHVGGGNGCNLEIGGQGHSNHACNHQYASAMLAGKGCDASLVISQLAQRCFACQLRSMERGETQGALNSFLNDFVHGA